jgi:hypothetical protein
MRMRQTIDLVFSDERLITPTGLSTVGNILGKSEFVRYCNQRRDVPKRSEPQIPNGDIALTYIGLLTQGKPAFESVNEMKSDPEYYQLALGLRKGIPSAETLRQRMDAIGDTIRSQILDANVKMFTSHGIEPSALSTGEVSLDMDVTPLDNSNTHKEGVSRTYKGCDGYAPMVAYIGGEGFMANIELREGKQHCQKHTPDFLRETLSCAHRITKKPLLIRMDSGNDAAENMGILLEDGSWFIVKRNLRKESKEDWLNEMKGCCKDIRRPREGKTVYVGSSWREVSYVTLKGATETKCLRMVYEITERTIDKHGQILMLPDIEVNIWWTNLGWTDNEIIASYHAHGESEQYHSELKTDMDVERLPSGKFDTNALVLELSMIAFNILRMIGQESLRYKQPEKRRVKRRRLRTVISNLIFCAGHLTCHARRMRLSLGRSNAWADAVYGVWKRFAPA